MYILRSVFVISGSSLYSGFIIVRFDCIYPLHFSNHPLLCMTLYVCTCVYTVHTRPIPGLVHIVLYVHVFRAVAECRSGIRYSYLIWGTFSQRLL